MKKYLMTMAAVLCCAMTTTVFTACGDDDDDNTGSPAQPTVVAYQVDYSVSFPQDNNVGNVFLLYDKIEVSYVDENGKEQREVVSNGNWSKSVTYKKTVDCDLTLYLTKPANLNTDNLPYEKYTEEVTFTPVLLKGITAIYSDGKKVPNTALSIETALVSSSLTFSKDKIQNYFEKVTREILPLSSFKLTL